MTKFKLTILILLITAFGVVVSGCVKKPQPAVNQNVNTATTTAEVDTSDWKTYRNEEYGFEFKYPGEWTKDETSKDIISFYGKDWLIEKDNFKKRLIWSELNVYYYDNFDNEKELINNIFNLYNYSTIADAVEKEIDLINYGQYNIDNQKIYRLEVAGERSIAYYFFPSKVKSRSFVVLAFPYNGGFERSILPTVKF